MIGDPEIYSLLYERDEDFKKIFKIRADFDSEMPKNEDSITQYVRFIQMVCDDEKLMPFDASALAQVIEFGVRLSGQQKKISTRFNIIADVAREAHYWALKAKKKIVTGEFVEKAIDERLYRVKLVEDKVQKLITDGTPMTGEARPFPFAQTPAEEWGSAFSPDGRFLAYVADESGRPEVFVRAFPPSPAKWQVSTSGGTQPLWSRDGRRVFFRGGGSVQEVSFAPGPPAAVSAPRVLFADRFENPQAGSHTGYVVFPDGRFLMIEPADKDHAGRRTEVVVVLDFLASVTAKLRGDPQ